ncbi:MAG: thiaminase II [Dysgonamonadaceae bacterium]|jgi:thiaminase/transcriptional activator TenA|nr:thiaminase II [Dysgonamonadaceae bacterium]
MKWSKFTWEATLPIYEKILDLPFIHGVIDGSLAEEKFEFYIRQDAMYIAEFGKILAGIASKLHNPDHILSFLQFSTESIQMERALHDSFLKKYPSSKEIEPSPSCLLYTSKMYQQFVTEPVEVAVASVLPCFWIYREVGNYIVKNQTKGQNPYQDWIDTYGGEDYAAIVDIAIAICDDLAAQTTEDIRRKMTEAFVMSSRMEWMFWDSAWRLEQWRV